MPQSKTKHPATVPKWSLGSIHINNDMNINIHIDINMNIDIHIIINMNIEDYNKYYLLIIRYY